MKTKQDELSINIAAYKKLQAELEASDLGKVALLSNGALVDVYNDFGDAHKIGLEKFSEGNFSVKTIGDDVQHIGFYGHIAEPVPVSAIV